MDENTNVLEQEAQDSAEETTQDVQQETTEQPAEDKADEVQAKAEKIANRLVAKKLSEAGFTKKGDLEAFKQWKEAQKTPEQKENEEVARLRQELAEANERAAALDRRQAVIDAKVNSEFVDFVAYSAAKSVDEDGEFSDALAAYLEANPQYTKQESKQAGQFAAGTGTAPAGGAQTGIDAEIAKRLAKYQKK